MEHGPTAPSIRLGELDFEILKPTRLTPSMVLVSPDRTLYARLGQKQTILEEQIHTVSLYERGFPVPKVVKSGESGEEWYFIETSLGSETFHQQFLSEFTSTGTVSSGLLSRYDVVIKKYAEAQFDEKNRTTISAEDFVTSVIPDDRILGNYASFGGDIARYRQAIDKATIALQGASMGVVQYDLNPFNVLDGGVIDFELVGYGPVGYDSLTSIRWHRWFTNYSSRHQIAYQIDETSIKTHDRMITKIAEQSGTSSPLTYLQEFLLLKTAWGFSSDESVYDEPADKAQFYNFRATLLQHAVDQYLLGKPINWVQFPNIQPGLQLLPR